MDYFFYSVRSLIQANRIKPEEIYFFLHSLGLEKRFAGFWKQSKFLQNIGLTIEADEAVDRRSSGWMALSGEHAWTAGNTEEAMQRYTQCASAGEVAGTAGQLRLHFVLAQFSECIAAFRRGCPPHAFYVEYAEYSKREHPDPQMQEFHLLCKRFPGKSFGFISKAKYMCQAIILAAVRSDQIDTSLQEMICDYFDIGSQELGELARALQDNGEEFTRIQRRLTPKNVPSTSHSEVMRKGNTKNSRYLRDCISQYPSFVSSATEHLDIFLDSGDETALDRMVEAGTPFQVARADAFMLDEVLESRNKRIAEFPNRRLVILRRFNPICSYPRYGFIEEYLEVMHQTQAPIEPTDIISAIVGIAWFKTPYRLDDTGPYTSEHGLGKPEIIYNREWLEIILRDYHPIFNRSCVASPTTMIEATFSAYKFLRGRYFEVRHSQRWINEAKLGEALAVLFGKDDIEQHSRPFWLSPQHLDYFLPTHRLAIEYMGLQHYQPVDVFGGLPAYLEMQKRDERKRRICERMGVSLVYVKHDEDVGQRAREIFEQYGKAVFTP